MSFEFTGNIYVSDEDFEEIIELMNKNRWTNRKAVYEWSTQLDDCDFYNIGKVMSDICAEVNRRIAAK